MEALSMMLKRHWEVCKLLQLCTHEYTQACTHVRASTLICTRTHRRNGTLMDSLSNNEETANQWHEGCGQYDLPCSTCWVDFKTKPIVLAAHPGRGQNKEGRHIPSDHWECLMLHEPSVLSGNIPTLLLASCETGHKNLLTAPLKSCAGAALLRPYV